MNEFTQLATSMMVLVFAAIMLVVGQLYIENGAKNAFVMPVAQVLLAR
jgi:hypothetical protein